MFDPLYHIIESLIPLGGIAMIIIIVVYIAKNRHEERMEMIVRGINPNIPIMEIKKRRSNKALFWGLLFTAVGLALFISGIFIERDEDMLTFGLLLFFGGASLIIYWRLTQRDKSKKDSEFDEFMATKNKKNEIFTEPEKKDIDSNN
jgi:uncharacterized membrane protein YgdD (TMEM256/DUF423 family)